MTTTTEQSARRRDMIPAGRAIAISARKIDRETAAKWGYTVSELNGKPCHVAAYRDATGNVVAQKLRFADKSFLFLGDPKAAGLYGAHLWSGPGQRIVVTEGEVDALSVSQVQGNRWPVVSLPNGAQGAVKALKDALPYLLRFETVVLAFDMDEPGRKAAAECARLFPPGRCKIAVLPCKDANECLMQGKADELQRALWEAQEWRPDGIVTLADVTADALKVPEIGLPWWDSRLTALTHGRRPGEAYALGAGTGIGKTDWLTQQITFDVDTLKEPVGLFFLEQPPAETAKRLAGKLVGKRFHMPAAVAGWEQRELETALARLQAGGKLFLFDHFGVSDWTLIRDTIRHLHHAHGVRLFYLDHLTALVAGEEDERKALETIMAEIGSLVKELSCIFLFVSHLATPEGRSHEEGGRVWIRHFKGSRAIGFWSHFMFALERDQQADDQDKRRTTTFRVLKDRHTGDATGRTLGLAYDTTTGLLLPADGPNAAQEHGF